MARTDKPLEERIPHVKNADVAGKTIFLRCDFNVPIDAKGGVLDESRICANLHTLHYLLDNGAKVIVASHLGRPGVLAGLGQDWRRPSLRGVAKRLETLLGREVPCVADPFADPETAGAVSQRLKDRVDEAFGKTEIVCLENVRFWGGEIVNDGDLGESYRSLADIFVNDAFGTCHREHASIVAVARNMPHYQGFLLYEELRQLRRLKQAKKENELYVVVLGGRETEFRHRAMKYLKPEPDYFLIGGDCACTIRAGFGRNVGTSWVDRRFTGQVRNVMRDVRRRGCQYELPEDVRVAPDLDDETDPINVKSSNIPPDMAVYDIGDEARNRLCEIVAAADRILWVGPMGLFTHWKHDGGTREIAKAIAFSGAYTVAGGADTMRAINRFGLARWYDHISTGGSAMLEYLSEQPMPGIAALLAPQPGKR